MTLALVVTGLVLELVDPDLRALGVGHELTGDGERRELVGLVRDGLAVDDEYGRQPERIARGALKLAAILLVDGDNLVTDAAKLANVTVSGEIAEHTKGPKIRIHKFKNKTGYHKRQGHRQPLTRVKVTGISSGK
jgi:large subunit ribosomal protein L21